MEIKSCINHDLAAIFCEPFASFVGVGWGFEHLDIDSIVLHAFRRGDRESNLLSVWGGGQYVLLFGLRTWIFSDIMQQQLDIIPKVRKEEYVGDIIIPDFASISLTEDKIKSAASI